MIYSFFCVWGRWLRISGHFVSMLYPEISIGTWSKMVAYRRCETVETNWNVFKKPFRHTSCAPISATGCYVSSHCFLEGSLSEIITPKFPASSKRLVFCSSVAITATKCQILIFVVCLVLFLPYNIGPAYTLHLWCLHFCLYLRAFGILPFGPHQAVSLDPKGALWRVPWTPGLWRSVSVLAVSLALLLMINHLSPPTPSDVTVILEYSTVQI